MKTQRSSRPLKLLRTFAERGAIRRGTQFRRVAVGTLCFLVENSRGKYLLEGERMLFLDAAGCARHGYT